LTDVLFGLCLLSLSDDVDNSRLERGDGNVLKMEAGSRSRDDKAAGRNSVTRGDNNKEKAVVKCLQGMRMSIKIDRSRQVRITASYWRAMAFMAVLDDKVYK